jgi:predicted metal-dependent hydrolase
MSTEQRYITVNGLHVEVVRKNIKNLHLAVYPPDGRIRVAVPECLDDEAVRLAVVSRLGWISRQRAQYEKQDRQSQREFVTGESHYIWGRRYRLNVIETDGPPKVRLSSKRTLELCVRPGTDCVKREQLLSHWYREQLRERIPDLIAKWERILSVQVSEWGIRKMKTKWGSCSVDTRRIWLNLELSKKPESCLEYVLVHEMVHLLERNHNERFREYMNRFMPQWWLIRDELNSAPLAHADWEY